MAGFHVTATSVTMGGFTVSITRKGGGWDLPGELGMMPLTVQYTATADFVPNVATANKPAFKVEYTVAR